MASGGLERRFAPWVDTVGDLLDVPGDLAVGVVLGELHNTFGTNVSWNWTDSDGSFGFQLHRPIAGWPGRDHMDFWASETLALHPLVRWFTTTGDLSAMTLGRVPATVAHRRGFEVVREHLRPVSIEQQLSIPYRNSATGHRAFLLVGTGADFSDEDLVLARRIQPLLILLARQSAVMARHRARSGEAAAAWGLTGREVTVLALLGEGHTATGIGRRLGISPRTVQVHLDHLYRKLEVHDRLTAVRVARDGGLLSTRPTCAPIKPAPAREHPDRTLAETGAEAHRAFAWRPGQGAVQVPER